MNLLVLCPHFAPDLAPTGDGNNTSAFVCRPTRGATTWSAHAYGLAVDVNPFCNPYLKGALVLPKPPAASPVASTPASLPASAP